MHKIKQTIFISHDEVREYGLSAPMAGNPVYITEEDNFLVPRLGSELYYEITKNRREILCIRDLISSNTITLEVKVKPPVVDKRNWIEKIFCYNPDDPDYGPIF
jgi:hypothetical protein